ncbi:ATP phosphoribosyltransferase HisG [Gottschalkia acidurici 9a]|uniref:ATP phosphoribosyltransferase n=1 Tax=Gottschalkia acidurici (strain ATCC 7906 / DSM 604 / BCRC 14475 / CIP 104303 / KCTC 5404 / NCIMB 10678 / 9a) TaxID=1128398 RepID=K0B1C4_GOTA9|nr:ATP phosphoribosyltransferase [Gottschalkia acidurici]AFS78765.1 ATP phosphoribosyltransferase HisG [Gottschalkia acidurici 9a]
MEYLNIAIAKGRLGDKGYELLKKIGLECREFEEDSRKLILTSEENKVRYVLVKAVDVPVYVERGAVDIGIVGKDTIMEEERNCYEIADLNFGKCKFAVAALDGYTIDPSKPLRVASKYTNVARKHFLSKGMQVDLIKLNGSVELAPLIGLSDVIVDIVETGRTLKENGLVVIEDIHPVSARMIANKVSFKIKNNRIKKIMDDLNKLIEKES